MQPNQHLSKHNSPAEHSQLSSLNQNQQFSQFSSIQSDSLKQGEVGQLQPLQIQNTLKTLRKLKKINKLKKLSDLKSRDPLVNMIFKRMHEFFSFRFNQAQKKKNQIKKLKQTRKKSIRQAGIRKRHFLKEALAPTNQQKQLKSNEQLPDKSKQNQYDLLQNNPLNKQLKKRKCYICKDLYSTIHHFYDCLCSPCADFNYQKRNQSSDLSNLVALVTGARIKIGFEIALKLLKDGATVIVTSRFFNDTYLRYSKQSDFNQWSSRLYIFECDFTSSSQVNQLVTKIKQKFTKLDILINNAAQTIVRPKQFYLQQLINQTKSVQNIPSHISQHKPNNRQQKSLPQTYPSLFLPEQRNQLTIDDTHKTHQSQSCSLSVVASSSKQHSILNFNCQQALIDHSIRHQFDQPLDKRPVNSWVQKLENISLVDTYTTHLVNSIVPFYLISQLKPLMKKAAHSRPSFIINVSSMQGVFYRNGKQSNHPHTNMAKAALNMITRTSARQFVLDSIYMNSVDTGWVTQENPFQYCSQQQNRLIPLDCVDGAMRVLDPIYDAVNNNNLVFGKFIKDYKQSNW